MEDVPTTTKETRRNLAEILGKDKARMIASIALAAGSLLGISGKPESGVGVGVEVPSPIWPGEPVSVGVLAYSSEGDLPLGLPKIPGQEYKNLEAYQVRIGGAGLVVYIGRLERGRSSARTVIGVFPAFETRLGK